MAPKVGRYADQFVLRLPEGMRDRIAKAAEQNGRSMNTEIVTRLEATFEREDVMDPGVPLPDSIKDLTEIQFDRLLAEMADNLRSFYRRRLAEATANAASDTHGKADSNEGD